MTNRSRISVPEVEAALERALALGEVGMQVAAFVDGELIVDSWTGAMGPGEAEPVDGDSLFPVFSVTKAITATALHVQVDRGLVDYGARVADYWPEFGAHGKERISVRDVLTHRAGIPQMPADATPELIADWDWMVRELAALEPMFEPGATSAYHSLNWGWLVGEVVRRTDPAGRPFDVFVREELFEPLGIDDIYLGLPPSEDHRVAWLVEVPADVEPNPVALASTPPLVAPDAAVHNQPAMWRAVDAGAGAILTARSGARFFGALACGGLLDGTRVVSSDLLEAATRPRANPLEIDQVGECIRFIGQGGYWLGGPHQPGGPVLGTGERVLWHPGAGGSYGWADLDRRLSVCICHNRMFNLEGTFAVGTHPWVAIGDAIRALAEQRAA